MSNLSSSAKRSLGQNFLIDPNLQRKIVRELEASPSDVVLEIGPGHGELSQHLVGEVAHLILVEKDAALASELQRRWADRDDVTVIEGDALDIDLRALAAPMSVLRVISNVPYNITSPLLFAFLALRPAANRMVLTVQREVAERVVARPGNKVYGALSVGVQSIADADLRFHIKPTAFRPVPDVESSVLRIDPDPERGTRVDSTRLRGLTRACFNRRRKQLQKILRSAPELGFDGDAPQFLANLGIDPQARPESLDAATFVRLSEALPALS